METLELVAGMYFPNVEQVKAEVADWLERGHIWETIDESWEGDKDTRLRISPKAMTLVCELLLIEGRIAAYQPGTNPQYLCYCAKSLIRSEEL